MLPIPPTSFYCCATSTTLHDAKADSTASAGAAHDLSSPIVSRTLRRRCGNSSLDTAATMTTKETGTRTVKRRRVEVYQMQQRQEEEEKQLRKQAGNATPTPTPAPSAPETTLPSSLSRRSRRSSLAQSKSAPTPPFSLNHHPTPTTTTNQSTNQPRSCSRPRSRKSQPSAASTTAYAIRGFLSTRTDPATGDELFLVDWAPVWMSLSEVQAEAEKYEISQILEVERRAEHQVDEAKKKEGKKGKKGGGKKRVIAGQRLLVEWAPIWVRREDLVMHEELIEQCIEIMQENEREREDGKNVGVDDGDYENMVIDDGGTIAIDTSTCRGHQKTTLTSINRRRTRVMSHYDFGDTGYYLSDVEIPDSEEDDNRDLRGVRECRSPEL